MSQHRKTVALTDKDDRFIAEQIASGEYGNASEVVRAGLRLLEQEQLKLNALRQAIAKGDADIAAGRSKTYKGGELAAEIRGAIPRKK
ncbi:MAG TPA: type II toxin-antitoxin system ParD family antitoxin [Aestuariivirgaceae bacterium]|jgi:antitoxin ParD1/3/4